MNEPHWHRSTSCNNGACVEVAIVPKGVLVRESNNHAIHLEYTTTEWRDFIAGVKRGEFDT